MGKIRRRELRHQVLEALKAHLESPVGTLLQPAESHHPADIADVLWLDFEPEEARRIFADMPLEHAAEVLAEAEPPLAERLTQEVDPAYLGDLLSLISADDGADILELLPSARAQQVFENLKPSDARDLRHLQEYPPDSAGGMMTTEIMVAHGEEKVGDILKRLKRDDDNAETIDNCYIVTPEGLLEGVISSRELLEAKIHDSVSDVMNPDIIHARVDEDREEIAHRILHYNLSTLPVTDARGSLVGIITADDALEVLEEEGSEDALLLAGAGTASAASEPLRQRVINRAPMLAITVLAGIAMSRLMELFAPATEAQDGSRWRILVPYVPMVLALAGTIGNQTSAILVRGFAVGLITPGRRTAVFLSEVQVGAALGVLCAVLAVPAAAWFAGDWRTGFSLGLALLLAMTWTATIASAIALGSEAAGLDPALVAGPVMVAVSDLSAVLLFFGTANLMLST